MTLRTITKTICIGVAVLLICYDVIPFLAPERGDTISEVIAKWGLKFFSLPFAFGVLVGHFFFLRDGTAPQPRVLLPLAAVMIALDAASSLWGVPVLGWLKLHPAVMLLAGIPVGLWFWPQTKSDKI